MGTLGNLLDSFSEQWPEVHPWGEESKAGFPVCRLHPFPPGLPSAPLPPGADLSPLGSSAWSPEAAGQRPLSALLGG